MLLLLYPSLLHVCTSLSSKSERIPPRIAYTRSFMSKQLLYGAGTDILMTTITVVAMHFSSRVSAQGW